MTRHPSKIRHSVLGISFLVFGATATAFGQTPPFQNHVLDGYMRGVEARQRQEALDRQKRDLELQSRKLDLNERQIRSLEQAARSKGLEQPTEKFSSTIEAEAQSQISKAFDALRELYPDFDQYLPKFTQVMSLFRPQQGALSVQEYVEGVYLIAKHASFLKRDVTIRQPG